MAHHLGLDLGRVAIRRTISAGCFLSVLGFLAIGVSFLRRMGVASLPRVTAGIVRLPFFGDAPFCASVALPIEDALALALPAGERPLCDGDGAGLALSARNLDAAFFPLARAARAFFPIPLRSPTPTRSTCGLARAAASRRCRRDSKPLGPAFALVAADAARALPARGLARPCNVRGSGTISDPALSESLTPASPHSSDSSSGPQSRISPSP
eukprot:scaffold10537_cov122-Isochrysis_galbana.AAC.22